MFLTQNSVEFIFVGILLLLIGLLIDSLIIQLKLNIEKKKIKNGIR